MPASPFTKWTAGHRRRPHRRVNRVGLQFPEHLLLGPEGSGCAPQVAAALGRPVISHQDPLFREFLTGLCGKLRLVMRTRNELTVPISGSGSVAMATMLANLLEPDDKVLVAVNGYVGERMAAMAERLGARVVRLAASWGSSFDHQDILTMVERERPVLVGIIQAETTTGAAQLLYGLGRALHERGALLLVDGCTSLGGMPLETDAWHIDAAFAVAHRCLSGPAGLALLTLGRRAVARISGRRTPVPPGHAFLPKLCEAWMDPYGQDRIPPINLLYGLDAALDLVLEEDPEGCWVRHRGVHGVLACGLERLGLSYRGDPSCRLPMVNVVQVPSGVDEAAIRHRLLNEHGIEIGGGLGAWSGTVWRIGLMGKNACVDAVYRLQAALRQELATVLGEHVVLAEATVGSADARGQA